MWLFFVQAILICMLAMAFAASIDETVAGSIDNGAHEQEGESSILKKLLKFKLFLG